MLMGRAPFAGNSPSEIFRNTCHGRLGLGRGGASLWDKLPAAARELIVGLMQLDHNLRFTGEQAMEHRWLATPAGEESGAVGAAQHHAVPEGRRRRPGSGGSGSRNGSRSGSGSRRGSRGNGGVGGAEDPPGAYGGTCRGDVAGGRPATESLKAVPPSSSSTSVATTTPTSSSGSTPGRRGIRGGGLPAGRGTVEQQQQQQQQPY